MAQKAKWTIVIQMNPATDLLNRSEHLFSELRTLPFTKDVNLLVVLSNLNLLGSNIIDAIAYGKPLLYELNSDISIFSPNHTLSLENVTEEKELKELFDYIKTNFVSDQYAYIVNDHGSGNGFAVTNGSYIYKTIIYHGALEDEEEIFNYCTSAYKIRGYELSWQYKVYNNKNYRMLIYKKRGETKPLTVSTFASATKKSKIKKWDVFGMDCCWAQMLENSYNMKDSAFYNVACEDQGPIAGFGMGLNLKEAIKNPNIKANEFAKLLCSNFYAKNYNDYNSDKDNYNHMGVCISALENNHTVAIIEYLNELVDFLEDKIEEPKEILKIVCARICCEDFMYDTNTDKDYFVNTIDVIHFLENLLYFFDGEQQLLVIVKKLLDVLNYD
jgi:hypothetical protein